LGQNPNREEQYGKSNAWKKICLDACGGHRPIERFLSEGVRLERQKAEMQQPKR
jgi:hypothetical protein